MPPNMTDAAAAEALAALRDVPLLHISDVGSALGQITDDLGRETLAQWLRNVTTRWCCFGDREQKRLGVGLKAWMGADMPELTALASHMGSLNISNFLKIPDRRVMGSEVQDLQPQ